MPTYMVQAAYTSTAWNKLVQRPENRMEALKPVIERLGGAILAWYYTFGDYDVVVIFEVPSNINAAAASMAIAGSGAVKDFKTSVLMSPDDGFDAMLLAQGAGYRDGVLGDSLAMAVSVVIGRFDGLTPFANHDQEGLFELMLLAGNVDQLDLGLEPGKESMGVVQETQGFLIAPQALIQERQLPGGFRLGQHRSGL